MLDPRLNPASDCRWRLLEEEHDTGLAIGTPLADAERIDRLAALEDLKAAASAAQALLAAELDTSRRAAEGARGVPASEQGRGVSAEVALARRESPHTLAALRAGAISEWRATLLVRETACLTREDRSAVDRELAGTPEAAAELGRLGTRGIVAAARKVAYRLDAQAVVDRSARASDDRFVSLRPAPDCLAVLTTMVPVAQGVAAYAALKAEADSARAAGDPRTRGQVMADALVTRITGQESAEQVPVCVNLVLDADALVHPTCRTPWCDAPVVQTDHVRDRARGGPTSLGNAQGLCEACNLAKSLPGWRSAPIGESNGPPTGAVITTPTGHVYSSAGSARHGPLP